MISYDEYKTIIEKLMQEIYEAEKQRHDETKKLRNELNELGKTSMLSDPERFSKILEELSALDSIHDIILK